MISYISRVITLKPGDIIFTGTPQGVIQGKPKDKQVWLKPGDKIACSLEKFGRIKIRAGVRANESAFDVRPASA